MSALRFVSLAAFLPLSVSGCTRTSQPASSSGSREGLGLTELAEAPATRRVWSGPSVDFEGSPSPDGRFISTTDWATNELALRDLAADTTRRLRHTASGTQSDGFPMGSVISPDGKAVVFTWFFGTEEPRLELRAAPTSGRDSGRVRTIAGRMRTIFASPDLASQSPQSFTPDGRRVATVLYRNDRTVQIAMIPVDSGSAQVLKTFDWRAPNDLAISPDGRWIAYDFPRSQQDPHRDVHVMALDGSSESAVLRDKGNDLVLGWTPGGSHLLVNSARGGTPGVWAVAMANGKAQGDPVLVRADVWRMIPLGTSGDGSIFYGLETGQRDLYTAAFDPESGKVLSQPMSVTGGANNVSPYAMAFSPDGQHVAYLVSRGIGTNPYSQSDIVISSLERGEVRRLAPDLSRVSKVYWMPDGRSLLVHARNQKGRGGLYRVTLADGAVTPVYQPVGALPQSMAITRDGSRVYFVASDSSFTATTISALDVATSKVSPVYRIQQRVSHIALSPDDRFVAVAHGTRGAGNSAIQVVSVESGVAHDLYRYTAGEEIWPVSVVSWSPDGKYVYFGVLNSKRRPDASGAEMRRIPSTGGTAEPIDLKLGNLSVFQISPDGRRIAYGVNHFAGEVWVMDPPKFSAVATRDPGSR